ncbi:MAG: histidine ammonia-lyase, partial [Bacteroidetes bacterium]
MKEDVYLISPEKLTFKAIFDILKKNKRIRLSDVAIEKIQKCRTYLDDKIKNQDEPIYGINTGFGALYNKNISREDLGRLQE